MIDWKTRIKNKAFWLALIPAVLVLAQTVAAMFGYQLDIAGLQENALALINALFVVLMILGIVTDPTTPGVSDGGTFDESENDA